MTRIPNILKKAARTDEVRGVYVTRPHLLDLQRTAGLAISQPNLAINTGRLGESHSRKRGHGVEFEEARLYQPGDEIRHIDWRVTARTGKAHTRQYTEQQQRDVLIAVDQRSNMFFGSQNCFKSWLAAVVTTQLGWSAVHHNARLTAAVAADDVQLIVAKSAQSAMFRYIDVVIEANRSLTAMQHSLVPLEDLLADIFASATSGTQVFIASDFHDLDRGSASILKGIGHKCSLSMLWIVDPLEEALPAAGWVGVSDGTERARQRLNRSTRVRYREHRERFEQQLNEYAKAASARVNKISTNDSASFMQRLPDGHG